MAPTALEACARRVRSGTGFFVAIVLGVQDYDAAFEER
jgi:hypothetical protein